MDNVYFKYKKHPKDLLRSTDVMMLPDPIENLEGFLVQFLKCYQSDERVAYINDLYKFLEEGFLDEEDKGSFIEIIKNKTDKEIEDELLRVEAELKNEAYINFYNLVQDNQIEIIYNVKN
ncbi:hypothetical protein [Runella zeae]|uniref:hypothetical protein n=1 Tax=Runella zeae TaxID=94255 RepID=UPI00048A4F6A|nr:hypothetical protein [Runella zeae]